MRYRRARASTRARRTGTASGPPPVPEFEPRIAYYTHYTTLPSASPAPHSLSISVSPRDGATYTPGPASSHHRRANPHGRVPLLPPLSTPLSYEHGTIHNQYTKPNTSLFSSLPGHLILHARARVALLYVTYKARGATDLSSYRNGAGTLARGAVLDASLLVVRGELAVHQSGDVALEPSGAELVEQQQLRVLDHVRQADPAEAKRRQLLQERDDGPGVPRRNIGGEAPVPQAITRLRRTDAAFGR